MQFEPGTSKQYAVSVSDPQRPRTRRSAGRDLHRGAHICSANGAPATGTTAIYTYNHAAWYVQEVERPHRLQRPRGLGAGGMTLPAYGAASSRPDPGDGDPERDGLPTSRRPANYGPNGRGHE